jgi:hypothetical protein
MTNSAIVWTMLALAAAAAVIVVGASAAAHRRSRVRTSVRRQQFGPEYDRAVQEFGNRAHAERELIPRTASAISRAGRGGSHALRVKLEPH